MASVLRGGILGTGGYLVFRHIKSNYRRNFLLGLLIGIYNYNIMVNP